MADPVGLIRKGLDLIASLHVEGACYLNVVSVLKDIEEEEVEYKGNGRWAIRLLGEEEEAEEETLSISEVIRYFQSKVSQIFAIAMDQVRPIEEDDEDDDDEYTRFYMLFPETDLDLDDLVLRAQPSLRNNIRLQPPGGPLRRVPKNSRPRNSVPYRGAGVNYLNAKRRFNDARSSY